MYGRHIFACCSGEELIAYSSASEQTMQDCVREAVAYYVSASGMRIAFERAGGKCVYSCEWNKYSQQTYFANFEDQPEGAITQVKAEYIPDHDILVAG